VLAVEGVTDCYVTENTENTSVLVGDYTLKANSLYIAVVGGNSNDVATAIWKKKPPGCAYNGNTSVIVFDSSSYYQQPYPQYTVLYETPNDVGVFFTVSLVLTDNVPSDAAQQIQNFIISAFAGADGGTRATMGSIILASRYYAGIAMLGSWAEIINIKLGLSAGGTLDLVTMGIDQMPVTSAANINVIIGQTQTGVLSIGAGYVMT
jgi:hypothetical protein